MKLNINNKPMSVKLRRVVGFLSPEFLLVLRGEGGLRRNMTAAHPSCLYRGEQGGEVFAALSTCSNNVTAVIVVNSTNYNVEFVSRVKREAEDMSSDSGDTHNMVITRTPAVTEHRYGLNTRNLKKMKVSERPVVRLRREARRSKRSSKERVIEIAVFVDYDMYQDNIETTEAATTAKIQDLVFTYLNAVQLLYQSSLLTNKLRLVLVRLDIMTSQPAELSTGGGDIETYLENFCRYKYLISTFYSVKLISGRQIIVSYNYSNTASLNLTAHTSRCQSVTDYGATLLTSSFQKLNFQMAES